MEIRAATESDVPEIVTLLKISLGESLMPKSEAFWRWKHIDNPFGHSPVLLAFENNTLIGVRAFMRWEWKQGDRIFKAVRAVDTATHPDYQGKGIFKTLTLQLVDQCKAEGVDFIFNTPNKSSKPGYIRMGWYEHGKLPVHVRPVFSLGAKRANAAPDYGIHQSVMIDWFSRFTFTFPKDQMISNYSPEFVRWRYAQCPNVTYFSFYDPLWTYFVFFRLKTNRFGIEFRICDLFTSAGFDHVAFGKKLKLVARQCGAALITFCGKSSPVGSIALGIGPMITLRPLTSVNLLSFERWKPSLGDMEVF